MKKLYLLTLVLLFMLTSNAVAAPTFNTVMSNSTDAISIDSQYSGSWENVDSVIFATSDSARVLVTATGTVSFDPGDVLYIGFGTASDTFNTNLDTLFYKYPKSARSGKVTMPFVGQYIFTAGDGATTDTIYLNAACGGSTQWEQVELNDVIISIDVGDL